MAEKLKWIKILTTENTKGITASEPIYLKNILKNGLFRLNNILQAVTNGEINMNSVGLLLTWNKGT